MEQVGGTLIHNRTGAILAMIEGRDFNESQVNFSRAGRQPGSAIKPVLDYAPAFELGLLQPASVIDDAPMYAYDYSQGRYKRFGNFSAALLRVGYSKKSGGTILQHSCHQSDANDGQPGPQRPA